MDEDGRSRGSQKRVDAVEHARNSIRRLGISPGDLISEAARFLSHGKGNVNEKASDECPIIGWRCATCYGKAGEHASSVFSRNI